MASSSQARARRVAWLVPAVVLTLVTSTLAGGLGFVEVQREGVGGVDGVRQADGVAVSPDDAHVYVAGRNDNALAVFSRNGATGALTFVEKRTDGSGGVTNMRQPTGVAVSPDGAHVYVASFLDGAVVVFSRNPLTGALTFVESKPNGSGGVAGLTMATAVAVSPDGAHVYATGEQDDSVVVFSRNALTGALTFVERRQDGVGGVDGLRRPTAIALSPDGAHVYVTGEGDDAVAAFSRSAITGALTFVEAEFDGLAGVDGLGRSTAVAVSPDGANVYVTSEHDNAIATFSRNAGTGALTFVEVDREGKQGVKGIRGAQSVVVSPDGTAVYVAGEFVSAIGFFHRDPTTGALTFFESYVDGRYGFDGLDGIFKIALTADGKSLYGATRGESAVGVFAIDRCGNGTVGSDEQCDDANVTPTDGCSATCRLELCPAIPQPTCILAGSRRASLRLKNAANDKGDQLSWSWRGGVTTAGALGDPTTTTSYLLCVYDASGAPQPRLALAAPNDGICKGLPCWSGASGSFRYRDQLLTPDGLRDGSTRAGASPNQSSLKFKGRGAHLFRLATAPPPLPLTAPVTVQLANSIGECWDAKFSVAPIDDPVNFKATSD